MKKKEQIYKPWPKNPMYLVSSAGTIFSLYKMREIGVVNSYGYHYCFLNGHWTASHRVVYETFVEPIKEGAQVNHISGVRTQNEPANLEQLTPKENTRHSFQILAKVRPRNTAKGMRSGKWRGYWWVNSTKYETLKAASKAEGIYLHNVRNWCYKETNGCRFEPIERIKPAKPYFTKSQNLK